MSFFVKHLNDAAPQDAQCHIEGKTKCVIQRAHDKFTLELSSSPQIEEEIGLLLKYPNSYKLSNAWVQGVNMYMGRSAVVVDNTESTGKQTITTATFFLGACSEKNMLWQFVINYIEPVTGKEIKLFYNFSTQR